MNDTKAETFDELSPIDWLIKLGREEKQPHTLLLDRAEADLARITAERERYRLDLARAIAWIDEQVSFSEADKFAGTTLFETWQEVQAALKQPF